MKRRNILKELLTTVFGSTTVKISGGKIFKSGDLFSTCDFSFDSLEKYTTLFKIAFLKDKPEIQKPNYPPEEFQRAESIQRLFAYLESYRYDLNFPKPDAPRANETAFKAAISILSAIFSKSDNTDKFAIANEDISSKFRETISLIKDNLAAYDIKASFDAVKASNTPIAFYDTEYSSDDSQYNYYLPIFGEFVIPKLPKIIYPVLLSIFIDTSKNYDKNSQLIFHCLTSSFFPYNKNNELLSPTNALYLTKPLSLKTIKRFPISFNYITHLDEDTIMNKYKSGNGDVLKYLVTEKAIKQYVDHNAPLIAEYEKSLVDYMDDLIRRVLDLQWLYNNSEKSIEKCREEVEKILIGYPEVYSYIDDCSEDVIRKQLLAILHRAIVFITFFININGELIAKFATTHKCEGHIKYIKGKIYGNSFKELTALSEKLKGTPTEAPKSLYECYYYTSSNELADLLNSISSYKNLLIKSKNSP